MSAHDLTSPPALPWRIIDAMGQPRGGVAADPGGLRFAGEFGGGGLAVGAGAFGGAVACLELALPRDHWLQGDCWLEGEESNDPVNLNFCLSGACDHHGLKGGNLFLGGRVSVFLDRPALPLARVRNGEERFLAVSLSLSRGGLRRLDAEERLRAPLRRLAQGRGPSASEAEFLMSPKLARVAHELARATRQGEYGNLFREAKNLELLALLFTEWTDRRTPPRLQLSARDRARLEETRLRLLTDLVAPPSIAELASQAGMGLTRFREGFHTLFGKPVAEYLRSARLETARHLIDQGVAIQSAAFRVGYLDHSSFTRAFRRYFGFPPAGCNPATPDPAP